MFEFLRRSFARRIRGKRPAASARTRANPLSFECLESRCLLSAWPSSSENLLPLGTIPTGTFYAAPSLVGVSLETLPRAEVIWPAPSERLPYPPLQPPADGTGNSGWPAVPPGGIFYPPLPPESTPDDSSQGGLIDIGDLETTEPGTLAEGATEKDIRAVLDLLASLHFVPNSERDEAPGLAQSLAAESQTAAQALVPGESWKRNLPEDGMIALTRDALLEVVPHAEQASGQGPDALQDVSLQDVTVQMDRVNARFQAFEVSTVAGLPPRLPAAPVSAEPISLLSPPDQAARSDRQSDAAPKVTAQPDVSVQPEFPAEMNSAAGNLSKLEEVIDNGISAAWLSTSRDPTTRPLLYTAAAAMFLAYVARFVRPTDPSEPNQRQPTIGCVPALSLRQPKKAGWLDIARKLFVAP